MEAVQRCITELSSIFKRLYVVHETVALDGKRRGKQRRQEIEIYCSFVGKVDLSED